MEQVGVDILGLFPRSERGNHAIEPSYWLWTISLNGLRGSNLPLPLLMEECILVHPRSCPT